MPQHGPAWGRTGSWFVPGGARRFFFVRLNLSASAWLRGVKKNGLS
jgi:hypothetical protein